MRNPFSVAFGVFLVFVGLAFLLDNLEILDAEWFIEQAWPFALILFGVFLLFWRKPGSSSANEAADIPERPDSPHGASSPKNFISASEVFGDLKIRSSSKDFVGGQCSVVFGDLKLDLKDIELNTGEHILRLSSVFGSIRIDLPETVEYCVKASIVAGTVSVKGDKRGGLVLSETIQSKGFVNAERRLMIHASLVFGEIKVF
jgi:lia operon protein LiaF